MGGVAGVVADDPALPERWGPDENIAWQVDIPGRAWSSPIVWGEHVFVLTVTRVSGTTDAQPMPIESYRARSLGGSMTGADIDREAEPLRWVLYDVDFETGAVRWERELHTAVPTLTAHQKNTFASETPVTDGERVYVYLGDIGLYAFDFEGNEAWSVPLEWLPRRNWGAAGSPILHDGRLYVVNDNDERSWVAAFDAATGEQVWRTDRDEGTNWSTPFVWENDVRTELVTTGTGGVRSYSLDGELLWELHGMSSLVIPTPFSDHGLLFINSGYIADSNRPVYAIRGGRQRRHLAGTGQHQQRLRRLVAPAARLLQPVVARLRRLPLHAARSRHPDVLRRPHRPAGLPAPARDRGDALHGIAVGVQRQDLRAERGRRNVRHPGGRRVRGALAQLAGRRDDNGDPGDRPREPLPADRVEAVPHRVGRRRLRATGGGEKRSTMDGMGERVGC